MKDIEFGKLIEKLIYFSGQKNYSLATELGYDVSYISKWISGSMLPTSKNIKNICSKTSYFVIKLANETSINEMLDFFNIDCKRLDAKDALRKRIEDDLNESYLFSANRLIRKSYNKNDGELNSILQINPKLRKKYLEEEIHSHINEKGNCNIIMLTNLFALSRDNKLNICGFRKGTSYQYDGSDIKIRFLINFEEDIKDIIFDVILLMNIVAGRGNIKFEIYSYDFDSNSLIIAVKERFIHTAIYTNNKKCLYTTISSEEKVVDEMYETLDQITSTQSRLTFLEKNPYEILMSEDYIEYIIGQDLKWIIGSMNELLMPSDLFIEIAEQVFENFPDIIENLRKIDAVLQNGTYKNNLQVLIYDSAIRKYVSTGELSFFNIPVNLTMEQRERHMSYMLKLIEENENIEVKLINGNLIEDFKFNQTPSIYISKNMNFLKIKDIDKAGRYMMVRDKKLDNMLNRFFDTVIEEKEELMTIDRESVKKRIEHSLMYTRILMNR